MKDYNQETKTLTQTIVAEQEEERALSIKMWFLVPPSLSFWPQTEADLGTFIESVAWHQA